MEFHIQRHAFYARAEQRDPPVLDALRKTPILTLADQALRYLLERRYQMALSVIEVTFDFVSQSSVENVLTSCGYLFFLQADALYGLGRYAEARAAYCAASTTQDAFSASDADIYHRATFNAGVCFVQECAFASALSCFEEVSSGGFSGSFERISNGGVDGGFGGGLDGVSHRSSDEFVDGKADYLDLALRYQIELLIVLDRLDEARELMNGVLLSDEAWSAFFEGRCAAALGDTSRAIRYYLQATRLHNSSPDFYTALARCYMSQDQSELACNALGQAIHLEPTAEKYYLRSQCTLDRASARADLEKVRELDSLYLELHAV